MESTNDAVIKIIGVGGGGGNAVEHMLRERIEAVEFFAVNTDAQALRKSAVLVNITAGFDLRLDEIETIGNTIRALASDCATVVIGTLLLLRTLSRLHKSRALFCKAAVDRGWHSQP